MQIGSFVWRFFNYGPIPALNYAKERFLSFDSSKIHLTNIIESCDELDSILKLPIGFTKKYQKLVTLEMDDYEKRFRKEFPSFKAKNIFGEHLSINRLLLIRVLIESQKVGTFIETGTQFGLSAYIAGNSCESKSISKVLSLDVVKNKYIPHHNVEYKVLKFPVRKNLNYILKNENRDSKIMFFHDSDHSFENMRYEFECVWKFTNVQCLISDDVEFNSAFVVFCEKHHLTPLFFKLDFGPLVGFVLR